MGLGPEEPGSIYDLGITALFHPLMLRIRTLECLRKLHIALWNQDFQDTTY